MSELTLSVEHTINAPIEFVYNAWLDPALMAKFMTPAPGVVATDISSEPHVGGQFAVTMIVDGDRLDHRGEYLALEPYTKLVFTWV
ncbi:MAG: SRPBCC domain-containing protein [OCS116 cluster bacterium]|nr:SRPBCC domain-containing protein [OCS116 cluster bacterium]